MRCEIRVVPLVEVAQLTHAAVAPREDLTLVCARGETNERGRNI
jgi:hypothetical protein